uniref:Uncharacterized protein n=1 Tax=Tetranychus urticae TaxID=32264 RepID=T1JXZ2_TETUR
MYKRSILISRYYNGPFCRIHNTKRAIANYL